MTAEQTFVRMLITGIAMTGLLCLNGCDYWPPALQSQIEMLRTELNDALDDRQRLDRDLTELSAAHAALERELDDKTRENEAMQRRLAALPGTRTRGAIARHEAPAVTLKSVRRPVTYNRRAETSLSFLRKGSYAPLQLERPHRRGPQVARLQRLLRRHELPIRVDGIYGRDTEAAVRSFQRVHGLPADGVVGPDTYRSLRRTAPAPRLVRQLSSRRPPLIGRDVSGVQRALRRAGYRIPIDGRFGPQTKNAVVRFQRKHGLVPDGMVGPRTWAVLKKTR